MVTASEVDEDGGIGRRGTKGASRCKADEKRVTADGVKRIRTEVPPRQGRRYRRHDGEDQDRSIAGALPPTWRTRRLERDERRLKGERRRTERERERELGWLRLASPRHHSPLGLAALSSSLLSFSLSSFSVRSSAARYGSVTPSCQRVRFVMGAHCRGNIGGFHR